VVADTLVFPNHQVSFVAFLFGLQSLIFEGERLLLRLCTGSLRAYLLLVWIYVSDWMYNRLVLEEATRTSVLLNPKSRFDRYDRLCGKKNQGSGLARLCLSDGSKPKKTILFTLL